MPKEYFTYLPLNSGSIEDEWKQCLKQIIQTQSDEKKLIKLNLFVDLPDYATYLKEKELIGKSMIDSFSKICPAFNVTVQPPEYPWKVTVEAAFLVSDSSKVVSKFWQSIPYVIIESKSGKEVWAGGLGTGLYPCDTRNAANAAFDQMVAILNNEQMSLNHLVRQWNYIGNILTVDQGFQNYQAFNEVRSEYYKRYRNISGYPSATGVGMKHGGVILDFCAIMSDGTTKIFAINNPNQINAYKYGQQVLKGLSDKGKTRKSPPQFERALLLANSKGSTLYVSGTASIIGQETIGKEDIEKQTIVTIGNIKKLTDPERIRQLTDKQVLFHENFKLLRVYIKYQKDFRKVKQICSKYFPQIPAIFIEADICRDDLLIEIEAALI